MIDHFLKTLRTEADRHQNAVEKKVLDRAAAAGKVADPTLRFVMVNLQNSDDSSSHVIDLDLLSADLASKIRTYLAADLREMFPSDSQLDEVHKAIHTAKPVTIQDEMTMFFD